MTILPKISEKIRPKPLGLNKPRTNLLEITAIFSSIMDIDILPKKSLEIRTNLFACFNPNNNNATGIRSNKFGSISKLKVEIIFCPKV